MTQNKVVLIFFVSLFCIAAFSLGYIAAYFDTQTINENKCSLEMFLKYNKLYSARHNVDYIEDKVQQDFDEYLKQWNSTK